MAEQTAHRKFYDFESLESSSKSDINSYKENNQKLINYINENIIGNQKGFSSPFGCKKVTYCDYIASGRSLKFIEDYILEQVLSQYGSTHTTTSVSSLQTTLFRHEARDIIRNAARASEHDRIIFIGSGSTGAINKLINGLAFDSPPVVFIDFTAHHSSLLPWREMGALVIRVKENQDGSLDENHLESLLLQYKSSKRRMIGCFSAASNITGLLVDTDSATILLHKYGALAFWDFATAAPYIDIVMNPVLTNDPTSLAHKDAIFFSLHKFVGGVQTPGVLIAKKFLFQNCVPEECGGGTVFFVSRENHRYLQDIEEREEGGTPPIVETIRGGMVMQLKMSLSPKLIQERCFQLSRKIRDFVSTVPEMIPLGNLCFDSRLPILSFLVKHPSSGKYLHYNYVSALLNDLFGVQSRGGCACAGPYAQDLLGIDEKLAERYEELLLENASLDRSHLRRKEEHGNLEVLRPGFVRINIPFTASDEQIDFILNAVKRVCSSGWKLLPQYVFNPETGEWKHHTNLVFKSRQWLQNISYSKGFFDPNLKSDSLSPPSYEEILKESDVIFEEADKVSLRLSVPDHGVLFEGEAEELRWFVLPFEVQKNLKSRIKTESTPFNVPFTPLAYPLSEDVLNKRPDYIWSKKKFTNITKEFSKLQINLTNGEHKTALRQDSLRNSPSSELTSDIDTELKNINVLNCINESCFVQRKLVPEKAMTKIEVLSNNAKIQWKSPPKILFNPTVEALETFSMIRHHDKVLVCLSGGKDSLSLLHTLRQYQFYAKSKGLAFSLGAVTVDPLSTSYDPRPLIPYLKELDVPYFYEQQDILKQAMEMESLNSICSFCSRLKRGRIYAAARREGYNVLALGQHLDDLAESFLMSVFHNGRLRTMKASYTVKEGDLRVIRPFIYVREKELRSFAESRKLPIIPENCPGCFESPKERHRVKQLLAQQEVLFPSLFWSLKRALGPLFSIGKTGLENSLFGKNCLTTNPPLTLLQNGSESGDRGDEDDEEIL